MANDRCSDCRKAGVRGSFGVLAATILWEVGALRLDTRPWGVIDGLLIFAASCRSYGQAY